MTVDCSIEAGRQLKQQLNNTETRQNTNSRGHVLSNVVNVMKTVIQDVQAMACLHRIYYGSVEYKSQQQPAFHTHCWYFLGRIDVDEHWSRYS